MTDTPRIEYFRRMRIGGGRRIVIWVISAVFLCVAIAPLVASFLLDAWWFESLGRGEVFRELIGTRVGLGVGFGLLFFVMLNANIAIVDRVAPTVRPISIAEAVWAKYRELLESRERVLRVVVTVLLALVGGYAASNQWNEWILFRNAQDIGMSDPLTGTDAGFFVFRLPFLLFMSDWLTIALILVFLVSLLSHFVAGSLHIPGSGHLTAPGVKVHLTALTVALVVSKGIGYWLDRYKLALTLRRPADGPASGVLYTDEYARLPMLVLLIMVCALVVVMLVLGIRRGDLLLPAVAMASWLAVSTVVANGYPWALQRFQVSQNQLAKEGEYLANHIASTRYAYGLDAVEQRNFNYRDTATDAEVGAARPSLQNARLLDPEIAKPSFDTLQAAQSYYTFTDIDTDRYLINGVATQVVVGVRDINSDNLPQSTWEARHLKFTAGYGLAMANASAVDASGQPQFVVDGIPMKVDSRFAETVSMERPQVYFSDRANNDPANQYAIVKTSLPEWNGTADATEPYSGTAGIPVGSFARRAVLALKFGQIEPLISDYLQSDSLLLHVRNVRDRAAKLAPFLQWDGDAYPVVANNRLVFIVDGYSTSEYFPNSQFASTVTGPRSGDLGNTEFNYVRNSVKAVIDAYDGSVRMYLTDEMNGERDPMIRAYAQAFPGLFLSDVPPELQAHFRYAGDLFVVQSEMWGRYHLDTPEAFFAQGERWDVAQRSPLRLTDSPQAETGLYEPQLVLGQIPDTQKEEFLLWRPYVPHDSQGDVKKKQLTSILMARSDGEQIGKLVAVNMTASREDGTLEPNRTVEGPQAVVESIQSDKDSGISEELSLLNQNKGGSEIRFGNMQIITVGSTLVYSRPLFVAANTTGSQATLERVIVWSGGKVAIGKSFPESFNQLYPGALPDGGESVEPPGPDQPDVTVNELLRQALEKFAAADAALKNGGGAALADYEASIKEAQALVDRALELGSTPASTEGDA